MTLWVASALAGAALAHAAGFTAIPRPGAAPRHMPDAFVLRLTPAAARLARVVPAPAGLARSLGLAGIDRVAADLGGATFEPEFPGETPPSPGSGLPDPGDGGVSPGNSGSNVGSEEHPSELQSRRDLVCRLLSPEKK